MSCAVGLASAFRSGLHRWRELVGPTHACCSLHLNSMPQVRTLLGVRDCSHGLRRLAGPDLHASVEMMEELSNNAISAFLAQTINLLQTIGRLEDGSPITDSVHAEFDGYALNNFERASISQVGMCSSRCDIRRMRHQGSLYKCCRSNSYRAGGRHILQRAVFLNSTDCAARMQVAAAAAPRLALAAAAV